MSEGAAPAGPRGEPAVRALATPADTNPAGDVFGGWIMSWMDVAGGISAPPRAGGRVATVAATDMAFPKPVKVGDVVCVHTDLARVGRTSATCRVEAWVLRQGHGGERMRVTAADLTTIALDAAGRPRPFADAGAVPATG